MKRIKLIFGCHSHQPVGNFDHVFHEAYEKAYKPFIDVLDRFPHVRVVLHYTGPLLDWFRANTPEYIERLAGLVRQNRIEIMGGGYYEPLLCAIPERDALDQIGRMQDFCEEHFGQRPRGMWLAERVWEPHMPRTLAEAGVEYTVLDDMHFKCSGLQPEELFGYYVTEDGGARLKLFPILEKLRYLIPFRQVKHTIAFLQEHATEDGRRCAVIHDDGEKFGIWPETYSSVYGEGWLEEFFQALTDNRDWIECTTYADYLDQEKALGRTYVTCASYQEMMAWALPTGMQRRLHAFQEEIKNDPDRLLFVRGGFWRNFLAKYPEANAMQKRMLRVSERVNRLRRGKNAAIEKARRLLHQGQCNCAYWHGVFGGLYLNHLRTAVYEKLIEADSVLDRLEHGREPWCVTETGDFDGDGQDEAILENAQAALFFSPSDGGSLFELDYKPRPFNLLNTLARREEAYHELLRSKLAQAAENAETHGSIHEIVRMKEPGLDRFLVYDTYRRSSLRDHFLAADTSAEALWSNSATELGDFVQGSYDFDTRKGALTLSRAGLAAGIPVKVRKAIKLKKDASRFKIQYDIQNDGDAPLAALFGVEFAVNLLTGSADDRYYFSEDRDLGRPQLGRSGCDDDLRHFALRDEWLRLGFEMRFSQPARIYRYPIETVSQSEGGQERVYQGSVVLPSWNLVCAPGAHVAFDLEVEVIGL